MRRLTILIGCFAVVLGAMALLEPVKATFPTLACGYVTPDMRACKDCAAERARNMCDGDVSCETEVYTFEYQQCVAIHCPPTRYLCQPDPNWPIPGE
jgi:hypothetical protein